MASTSRSSKQLPATAKVSEVIANFQPTRRFGNAPGSKPYSVTSIDFDDTGELCLVAQDDETLQIYNCKEGKHAKEMKSQKYGVDIARFTHHPQSIIYASTKGDDAIRYLSSHDNSYLRYFRGHTAPVTCINLNPSNDTFMSSSLDNTVRLWDLRSQYPQGQLDLTTPLLCTFDPTASVIAIACLAAQSLLLYDSRQYDKAPFATFELEEHESYFSRGEKPGSWTKLEFSNDGKKVLVATTGAGHYVLDAFEGELIAFCARPYGATNRIRPLDLSSLRAQQSHGPVRHGAISNTQGDVCFTPDGRYLVGGGGESSIYVWDLQVKESQRDGANNLESKILRPSHELSSGSKLASNNSVIAYNPRHNLMATADKNLIFWLPEMD